MKITKIISLLSLLLLITACENAPDRKMEEENTMTAEEVTDPDVISREWHDAWNSNDPAQVKQQMSAEAVLVMNGQEYEKDSINSWMEMASTNMRDLQMEMLQRGASGNIAYETGKFAHGVKENDSIHFNGTYTFIWERDEASEEWKVKVMDISDETPEPEMEE